VVKISDYSVRSASHMTTMSTAVLTTPLPEGWGVGRTCHWHFPLSDEEKVSWKAENTRIKRVKKNEYDKENQSKPAEVIKASKFKVSNIDPKAKNRAPSGYLNRIEILKVDPETILESSGVDGETIAELDARLNDPGVLREKELAEEEEAEEKEDLKSARRQAECNITYRGSDGAKVAISRPKVAACKFFF
jgi:hypothetical protein